VADGGRLVAEGGSSRQVRGVPRGRIDVARAETPRTSWFMTRTRCRHPGSTSSNEPKKAHLDCAVLGSGAKGARARARAEPPRYIVCYGASRFPSSARAAHQWTSIICCLRCSTPFPSSRLSTIVGASEPMRAAVHVPIAERQAVAAQRADVAAP